LNGPPRDSRQELEIYLQFDRVRCIWGSDDMGFRSGLLISPTDTRELVLAGHTRMAALTHEAGRIYLLHSCGDLSAIREELIGDVKIDAKQSYGHHLTLLGGIDVDFLCRSTEEEMRACVRRTLGAYLAMKDEGRRYSA